MFYDGAIVDEKNTDEEKLLFKYGKMPYKCDAHVEVRSRRVGGATFRFYAFVDEKCRQL